METKVTQQEIDNTEDLCREQVSEGTSKFRGMSYEEGVLATIEWLFYAAPNSMED